MVRSDPFPEVRPHGDLIELFSRIYCAIGTCSVGGPLPMRFSRNMAIVRQNNELTLISSVRLNDTGLSGLEKLGRVKHVVLLAGFHGMDDPFYKNRSDTAV